MSHSFCSLASLSLPSKPCFLSCFCSCFLFLSLGDPHEETLLLNMTVWGLTAQIFELVYLFANVVVLILLDRAQVGQGLSQGARQELRTLTWASTALLIWDSFFRLDLIHYLLTAIFEGTELEDMDTVVSRSVFCSFASGAFLLSISSLSLVDFSPFIFVLSLYFSVCFCFCVQLFLLCLFHYLCNW